MISLLPLFVSKRMQHARHEQLGSWTQSDGSAPGMLQEADTDEIGIIGREPQGRNQVTAE